jgi:hypothetical protein
MSLSAPKRNKISLRLLLNELSCRPFGADRVTDLPSDLESVPVPLILGLSSPVRGVVLVCMCGILLGEVRVRSLGRGLLQGPSPPSIVGCFN